MKAEVKELTEQEYRAYPAINISTLKEVENSPAHYKLALEQPSEQTKAMAFGSAFHCLMLEREKFPERYFITPKIDKRTKAGKQAFAEMQEQAQGKTIIDQSEYETLELMVDSLRQNPNVLELMQGTEREKNIFGQIDGIDCKCRVDAIKQGFLIDVKTTESAHPKKFDYSMKKYGYLYQAEFYMALTGIDTFHVIAVEKTPPFANNVFALNPSPERMNKIREWLSIVKKCQEENYWPNYSEDVIYLGDD